MKNIFLGFFEKSKDYSNYDTCIVLYDRSKYLDVLKVFKDFTYDLDYWVAINWDNKFYDMIVFNKEDNMFYKPVYILRDCSTPFMAKDKNGVLQPRGWFYKNLKPVRYTGVGNSMYLTKEDFDIDFSVKGLFMIKSMFTDKDDKVESNIKSFENIDSYGQEFLDSEFISYIQDNSLRVESTRDSNGKFKFGLKQLTN